MFTLIYSVVPKLHDFILWNIKDYILKNVSTIQNITFYVSQKKEYLTGLGWHEGEYDDSFNFHFCGNSPVKIIISW